MFFIKRGLLIFILLFNGAFNAQELSWINKTKEEIVPLVLGVSTPNIEFFSKMINELQKTEGIYIQKWCSSHHLIELTVDLFIFNSINNFIAFLEKKFPDVCFFQKEYTPIEKIQGCEGTVKSNF
ncbi:MAG: hypothetical protein N2Z72_08355 [Bacteroidales bacterium]|nr:hypothetical protein [Bacteroidales bacterium]